MNLLFKQQLSDAYSHFIAGDTDLGYRRLLDCAIETQNPEIFKRTLAFCDWYDSGIGQFHGDEILSEVSGLLQCMEQVDIHIKERNDEPVLTVENISKAYDKGGFSLSQISFYLKYGEIIGLVGENGNGKTTLLRLITQEIKRDGGNITYNLERSPKDLYELRSQLVYIEQRLPRWHGTLMDNLQFTLAHHGIRGEENLLWVELILARFGLRKYKDRSWKQISSGYKTRFEIAQTLLRKPKILLLDEPLANLDIFAQQVLLQDLKFLANSMTAPFGIMLSSQHIYEVEKVSDSIIFLRNGIPQYQQYPESVTVQNTDLVIELEAKGETRETIREAFACLPLLQVHFNGGVYVLKFKSGTSTRDILDVLIRKNICLSYYRDISTSSRRFFIN